MEHLVKIIILASLSLIAIGVSSFLFKLDLSQAFYWSVFGMVFDNIAKYSGEE